MTWYAWVIVVAAVLLTGIMVYLCMKYDWLKIVVKIVLVVAVLGSGCYTGYQIFLLNTATGGTHGKLEGVYGTNEVEVVDNLKFNLHNTEFRLLEESSYDLTVDVEQIMQLDITKNYNIFINDIPCSNASCSFSGDKFITANYRYNYYTRSDHLEMTDSLKISVVFYKTYTRISLKTDGGEDAVKYWNAYVNKNNFEISVRETGYRRNKNFVILTTANEIFEKAIEKYDPNFNICNTIIDGENVYVQGTGKMLDGTPVDLLYTLNIPGLGTDACDSEDELATAVSKIDASTIGETRAISIDYYLDRQIGIKSDTIDRFKQERKAVYYVTSKQCKDSVTEIGAPEVLIRELVKIEDGIVSKSDGGAAAAEKEIMNREGLIVVCVLKKEYGERYVQPSGVIYYQNSNNQNGNLPDSEDASDIIK